MVTYERKRVELMQSESSRTKPRIVISGVPLESDDAGRQAIVSCLCVQDSPENPCPCDGPIVWFPKESVLESRRMSQVSSEGEARYEYGLDPNAAVTVELVRTASASKVASLLGNAGKKDANQRQRGRTLGVMTAPIQGTGAAGPASAVMGAFTLGLLVGRYVDEQSGGAVSDAGADLIEDVASTASEIWDWLTS